jgi:hypothetical protein
MSGPGGSTTKRDQRRDSRRQQLQQRQLARQRERQRQIRNQRIRLGSIVGGAVLLVALIAVLIVTHQGPSASNNTGLKPATGQVVDSMECTTGEQLVFHIHAYLEIYVNGEPVTVPPGVGIVSPPGSGISALGSSGALQCFYPLHVHDTEPNIIHVESPIQKVYTLGNLFDVWGKQLSGTQVMGNPVDGAHQVKYVVYDASGKMIQVTTDPRAIGLADHETVVILYNSPNVQPKPFTDWAKYKL